MTNLKNYKDFELVPLIKKGIKTAYEELFERYAPRIYQFSLSYLKNELDAEGLVQDVFLKIWERREKLDSTKNIKSFIFKIAVNSIYDLIRSRNIEHAFQDFIQAQENSNTDSTWHTVILEEMLMNLDKLVKQMPEQRRKIFQMSREKDLSNDEIANELNLSKRTVENQLYRAIVFLKKHFNTDSLLALLFFYIWCG
jgi:RNA polymerase sigma-70 factor (ECF subfamily)